MKTSNYLKAIQKVQIKIILTCCILFFNSFFTVAQNWTNVGASFCSNEGCGCTFKMSSLAVYNGKLYAGGDASNGILSALGSWDGSQWDSLNTKFNETAFVGVNAMCEFNGDLYVGGYFPNIAGIINVNGIAKWNGTNWSAVGTGITSISEFASIYAMAEYNGSLYIGGTFDSVDGIPARNIAKWNGTTWSAVGSGISVSINNYIINDVGVNAMVGYNGNLYVGGCFDSAGTVVAHNIAIWNGSNWSTFGGGIPNGSKLVVDHTQNYSYSVNALDSFNGNLYVGGFFDSTGTGAALNIACWNGLNWTTLSNGLNIPGDTSYDPVNVIYEYNNILYAGGGFTNAGSQTVNGIAQWNGSSWAGLGSGIRGGYFSSVNAITVYNNQLYIDGSFDSAGTIQSCCLAEWNMPLAVNEISSDNSISVYPNPSNGLFTIVSTSHSAPSEEGVSAIEVYNVLGEKIISTNNLKWTNNLSNGNFQMSIDLSNQPSGIYLYKISDQNGTIISSGKLIKE